MRYTFETAQNVKYSADEFDKITFTEDEKLDLGFYEGDVWIRIKVENLGKPTSLVVLCGDLINRNYRFYQLDTLTQRLASDSTLDLSYTDHRTHNFPKPNFQIDLAAGEKAVYYITTNSDGRILQASPELITFNHFLAIQKETLLFDLLFYGSIFILILINFFYFQSIKNNIYYFYMAYILASCLMYLFVEGRLYDLGLSHLLIDHLMFLSIRVWIVSSVVFSMKFLKIKQTNLRFYRFMIFMLVAVLGLSTVYQLAFPYTSISSLHEFENLLGFMWTVLAFTMVGISFKKQWLVSTYYLIAYSTFVFFVTLGLIDSHTALLPGDPFSYFKIGTLFEFAGFTYFISALIKKKLITSEQMEKRMDEMEKQLSVDRSIKKTDFAKILKLVEHSLTTEEDWNAFKAQFETLQPDFYKKLLEAHADLSTAEIRLIFLIHIGYSQKEIASILHIAPPSVKKGRSRVRKKLSVPQEMPLQDYLSQFS